MARKKSAKSAPSKKKAKGKRSTTAKKQSQRVRVGRTPDFQPTLNAIFDSVLNLHARVSRHDTWAAAEGGAPSAAAKTAAMEIEADQKHILFKKTSGPDFVRVTLLDDSNVALRFFATDGKSEEPRKLGAVVPAFFEMRSNKPNDKAEIAVTNATPSKVSLESRRGGTGNSFTLDLTVK